MSILLLAVSVNLGSGDCEMFRSGSVAQPVNAWSSLAFLAAGLSILYGGLRHPEARRELSVFGALVIANAAGSFAYHGPAPVWGHWLHDVPAVGVPLFVAVHDLGLVRGWSIPKRLAVFAGFLALVGVVLAFAPAATLVLATIAVASAAAGELAASRSGFRPRPSDGWSAWMFWWLVVVFALVLAGISFLLGRTASPVCRPESWLQFHASWHVLGALAAAAFAYAGLEHGSSRLETPAPPPSRGKQLPP